MPLTFKNLSHVSMLLIALGALNSGLAVQNTAASLGIVHLPLESEINEAGDDSFEPFIDRDLSTQQKIDMALHENLRKRTVKDLEHRSEPNAENTYNQDFQTSDSDYRTNNTGNTNVGVSALEFPNKLQVNIGTIGHVDHGKTTLTAALPKPDEMQKETFQKRRIKMKDLNGNTYFLLAPETIRQDY